MSKGRQKTLDLQNSTGKRQAMTEKRDLTLCVLILTSSIVFGAAQTFEEPNAGHTTFPSIPSHVTVINLERNRLTAIEDTDLTSFENLTTLRLSHNEIATVGNLTFATLHLKYVNLSHNALTSVPDLLHSKATIKELNLGGNLIAAVELNKLSNMPNLKRLYLNKNALSELALGDLPSLISLEVSENQLVSAVDFTHVMPALTTLTSSHNKLQNVGPSNFSNTPNIETIQLNNNELRTFSISNLTQLRNIQIGTNLALDSVIIGSCDALYQLRVGIAALRALPTCSTIMVGLQILQADANKIANVSKEYFIKTPALKDLFLGNNQLKMFDASYLPNLRFLSLAYNDLESFPNISNSPLVQTLRIESNEIDRIDTKQYNTPNVVKEFKIGSNPGLYRVEQELDQFLQSTPYLENLDLRYSDLRKVPEIRNLNR